MAICCFGSKSDVCDICGKPANPFFRTQYGQHYCSFRCLCIGNRILLLCLTILYISLSITGFLVIALISFEYRNIFFIFPSILFLAGIYSLVSTIYGFRNHRSIKKTSYSNNLGNSGLIMNFSFIGPNVFSPNMDNKVCGICKMKLKIPEEFYQCLNCQSVFHVDHLKTWLEMKNECPVCKSSK